MGESRGPRGLRAWVRRVAAGAGALTIGATGMVSLAGPAAAESDSPYIEHSIEGDTFTLVCAPDLGGPNWVLRDASWWISDGYGDTLSGSAGPADRYDIDLRPLHGGQYTANLGCVYRATYGDETGYTPYSEQTSFSYITAPSAVRDLNATPGDGQVELTWSAPEYASSQPVTYVVTSDRGLSTTTPDTHFTDVELTNGVPVSYTVAARTSAGTGTAVGTSATPVGPLPGGGTGDPGTDDPGTDQPGTDDPGTDQPGTDQPGTDDPGTDQPDDSDPHTPGGTPSTPTTPTTPETPATPTTPAPTTPALTVPSSVTAAVASPVRVTVGLPAAPAPRPATLVVTEAGRVLATVAVPATGDLVVDLGVLAPGTHSLVLSTPAGPGVLAWSAPLTASVAGEPAATLGAPAARLAGSTDRTQAGGEITLVGRDFQPGETVAFYLHSEPVLLGTAVADADGVATLRVTLPADVPAGAHHVVATGGTSGRVAEIALTVGTGAPAAAPAAAAAGGELAVTGSSTGALVALQVALVTVGVLLLALRRRLVTRG